MYTSFHIKNFRCFDNLKLDNLARVNLIAGKNNVGKTALLEALFIYSGSYDLQLTIMVNNLRGITSLKVDFGAASQTIWDNLFKDFNNKQSIELIGHDTVYGRQSVRLKIVKNQRQLGEIVRILQQGENGFESTSLSSTSSQVIGLEHEDKSGKVSKYHMLLDRQGKLITQSTPVGSIPAFIFRIGRTGMVDDAEKYGNLIRLKQEEVVLKFLKIIEPRLDRLEVFPVAGISTIHGDVGLSVLVPLQLMGDGLSRLASIIVNMGNLRSGVMLIDEVENGLHYSVMRDVWKGIAEAANVFNVQVFATTHSLDCIRAAHEAFAQSEPYDFRYHRLDRTKSGDIRVVSYDQDVMEAAIEADSEVR